MHGSDLTSIGSIICRNDGIQLEWTNFQSSRIRISELHASIVRFWNGMRRVAETFQFNRYSFKFQSYKYICFIVLVVVLFESKWSLKSIRLNDWLLLSFQSIVIVVFCEPLHQTTTKLIERWWIPKISKHLWIVCLK